MNNKTFNRLTFCLCLSILGCSKDNPMPENSAVLEEFTQSEQGAVSFRGATQISGVGYYADADECNAVGDATYAVRMTGDLVGCLYVYVDEFDCSPSGTYRESGREYFVGTYDGGAGTFWTGYNFESKFEGCSEDGSYLGAEIFGRCQHPITPGSGTGVFEGVTGRLDFKDDIAAGNFPYKGHLRF
jgi:hypothetical protein